MAETLKVSSLSKAMVLTILATPASLLASTKATPTMATDPATMTTPAVNAATKAPPRKHRPLTAVPREHRYQPSPRPIGPSLSEPRGHHDCRKDCDERRVEWRVDSTRKEEPPSAANYHPSNPYHPDTHGNPGSLLRSDTGPDSNIDTDSNTSTDCNGDANGRTDGDANHFPSPRGTNTNPNTRRETCSRSASGLRVPTVRSLQRRARVHRR